MSASGDPSGGVPPMPVDEQTVDRLLSGAVDPDDAPPGYAEVAALLQAAQSADGGRERSAATERIFEGTVPASSAEEERQVKAMVAAISASTDESCALSKKRPLLTPRRAKLGGLVLAGVLFATTGLALAGDLPRAAQRFASEALSRVGISIPNGRESSSTVAATGQTGTPGPHLDQGPGATGLAKLCTALFSGQSGRNISGDHSTALRNLQNAARAADQSVQDFCRRATSVARRSAHHSRARPGNGNNRGHPQPPPKSHAGDHEGRQGKARVFRPPLRHGRAPNPNRFPVKRSRGAECGADLPPIPLWENLPTGGLGNALHYAPLKRVLHSTVELRVEMSNESAQSAVAAEPDYSKLCAFPLGAVRNRGGTEFRRPGTVRKALQPARMGARAR